MFSWTRSFLGGFGLGSGGRRPTLSEEGEEALTDMASLARASSEDFEAGGDDDDDALSEIEEFIRVAVLLLHGDQRTGIAAGEYKRRRRQLMDMAGEDAILVLPAAAEKVRSLDTHYPFRQDSDFQYLSGFPEPEAVLVLIPGRRHGEAILFCRERDAEREAWDGSRAGQEGAVAQFGMDDAYPIDDLDDILPGLLEGRSRVYYHFGRDADFDLKLIGWVNRVRSQVRHGAQPPHEFLELGHLLHEQRLFKSGAEVALMQHAAQISVRAHLAAMKAAKAGIHEYELQAELERVFRANDAVPAYCSIVGAGRNGCILHYRDNNARSRDGELVLIDAGAEYRGYASDITRTFPVNGRFSAEQRALHDLVGEAQAAALAQAKPGVPACCGWAC
ncbi:hypothetical protein G6F57_015126 [Rhizopus arrhizus]|nr:hypothetical protein G6F57_015126 [Rhizopus arrhizus]